jgi:hypothetical protein
MPPTVGMGSGTETAITAEYLAMRLDRLIELLQDCLGVTGDDGDVLAKGDDADNLQSFNGDNAILPATDGAGNNSATRITQGSKLADEGDGSTTPSGGGGKSVDGLLASNGRCPRHARRPPRCGSQRVRAPRHRRRPGRVSARCVGGQRIRTANARNCRTQSTRGQCVDVPHHRDARQFVHQVSWILRDQPWDDGQVRAERHVDYVHVRQVHGQGHAGLPLAPTLLLVNDDDGGSGHFDIPG